MMVTVWTTVFCGVVTAAVVAFFWIGGSKALKKMSPEEYAAFRARHNLDD